MKLHFSNDIHCMSNKERQQTAAIYIDIIPFISYKYQALQYKLLSANNRCNVRYISIEIKPSNKPYF